MQRFALRYLLVSMVVALLLVGCILTGKSQTTSGSVVSTPLADLKPDPTDGDLPKIGQLSRMAKNSADKAAKAANDAVVIAGKKPDWGGVFTATMAGAGIVAVPTIVVLFALYAYDQNSRKSKLKPQPGVSSYPDANLPENFTNILHKEMVKQSQEMHGELSRISDNLRSQIGEIQRSITQSGRVVGISGQGQVEGEAKMVEKLTQLQSRMQEMHQTLAAQRSSIGGKEAEQISQIVRNEIHNAVQTQFALSRSTGSSIPTALPAEWQQLIRRTVEESIANALRQQAPVSSGTVTHREISQPLQENPDRNFRRTLESDSRPSQVEPGNYTAPLYTKTHDNDGNAMNYATNETHPIRTDPALATPVSDGNWEVEWRQLHDRLAARMPAVSTSMTDLRKDWQTLQHAYTWLVEKWEGITNTMEDEGRKSNIKGWLPNIDQALYTDLSQLITLQQGGKGAKEYGDTLRAIIQVAQCGQEARKAELEAWGLERIEATPGTLRKSVLDLNDSLNEFEPTNDPQQDDRVVRINPGKGGYRLNGKTLISGEAVCYRYQS